MKKSSLSLIALSSLLLLASCGGSSGSASSAAPYSSVQTLNSFSTTGSDNFNRADGAIGSDWSAVGLFNTPTPVIKSNALRPAGTNNNSIAYHKQVLTGPKIRLSLKVSGLTASVETASFILDNNNNIGDGYIIVSCQYAQLGMAECHMWSGFNGGGNWVVQTGPFSILNNSLKMEVLLDGTNATLNMLDPNNGTTLAGSISYDFQSSLTSFKRVGLYLLSTNKQISVDDFKIEERQ